MPDYEPLPLDAPAPPPPNPGPVLVRVALLGTRQASDALPDLRALGLAAGPPPAAREAHVLLGAGMLSFVQKAGFQPLSGTAAPIPAPAEARPLLGAQGTALLRQLLATAYYRQQLLASYLGQVAQHQRVVPPALLAEVLDWLHTQPASGQVAAMGALGERGRWLAA